MQPHLALNAIKLRELFSIILSFPPACIYYNFKDSDLFIAGESGGYPLGHPGFCIIDKILNFDKVKITGDNQKR